MKISRIERQIQLNKLWHGYLQVCKSKQHAINAMRKVTGKKWSADFTDADIGNLCDDINRREDDVKGLNGLEYTNYNGEYADL